MRIISRKRLKDFREKHKDSEQTLKCRYSEIKGSNFQSPNEVLEKYSKASILSQTRIVFRLKGNSYRLIASCNYNLGIVRVRFVGTHQEYDKVNANTI